MENNYSSSSAGILLLMDSNSLMRETLRDALASAGYLVITAKDLGSAVDRLSQVQPDLLITRPYIDSLPGNVAAEYLRSKHPGLPVLIVAGFLEDDRTNVQNAIEEFYTFPRPFSRDELLAKIREVLHTSQMTAQKRACNNRVDSD